MRVDFAKGFGYPAREAGWPVKLGLASLFSYIIIGIPLTAGFIVESYRTSAEGDDQKMPEIADFSSMLLKGIQAILLGVIFFFVPVTCMGMGFGSSVLGVLSSVQSGSSAGLATGLGMGVVWIAVGALLGLLAYLVLPMATLRLATQGVGAAFDIGGILSDIKKGPLDYLAILVAIAVIGKLFGLAAAFFSPLALAMPLFGVYLSLVMANLLGQYQRLYLGEV